MLQSPSPYGSTQQRLEGLYLHSAMSSFTGVPLPAPAQNPPRLAHFILIQHILGYMNNHIDSFRHEPGRTHIGIILRNWFLSFVESSKQNTSPGFWYDSLPYWFLAHATLFTLGRGTLCVDDDPDTRLAMSLEWSQEIRRYMDTNPEITQEIFDRLMKCGRGSPRASRLQELDTEKLNAKAEDDELESAIVPFLSFKFED